MKRSLKVLVVVIVLFAGMGLAWAGPRDFILLARGQGAGSTDLDGLIASAGGVITAKLPDIGVVLASPTTRIS